MVECGCLLGDLVICAGKFCVVIPVFITSLLTVLVHVGKCKLIRVDPSRPVSEEFSRLERD